MSGYALCTTIRSGSPWLAALLASTGQLGRPAEFFSTKFQKRVVSPDYPETVRAQVAYALEHGRTPNGIYGFKIDPMQFDGLSSRVAWTACFPDLRFVPFARRDRLGQAISRVRANQTLQWRSTLPAGAAPRYDGDAILAAMRGISRPGRAPGPVLRPHRHRAAPHRRGRGLVPAAPERIAVAVQRSALSAEWRERFVAEHGTPDTIDAPPGGMMQKTAGGVAFPCDLLWPFQAQACRRTRRYRAGSQASVCRRSATSRRRASSPDSRSRAIVSAPMRKAR